MICPEISKSTDVALYQAVVDQITFLDPEKNETSFARLQLGTATMASLLWNIFLVVGLFSTWGYCQNRTSTTLGSGDHPPVPTASFQALPLEFQDIPQNYQECWTSFYGYSFTRNFLFSEFLKSSTRIATTFDPPRTGTSFYSYTTSQNCSTTLFGTSTLCDDIPRFSSRDINCLIGTVVGTITYVEYQSEITAITPTWTSEFAKPRPTCQVAPDLSPACARMFDALRWHTDQWRSQTLAPAEITSRLYIAVPECTPLNTPSTTDPPICRMFAGTYEAYHWPKTSTSDFCNAEPTAPNGTPTISTPPRTTVISGHTLTSPSVYQFLKNVQVETYKGWAHQPLGLGGLASNIWILSSAVPIATVAVLEKDILTASESCSGREWDYCTIEFDPGFRVHDISTVRAEIYSSHCSYYRCDSSDRGVIYQSSYRPTMVVPVSDVVNQNGGIFKDCYFIYDDHNSSGDRSYTISESAAILVKDATSTQFVPIATTAGEVTRTGTAAPGATWTTSVRPTGSVGLG